jgi:hypothetical protein
MEIGEMLKWGDVEMGNEFMEYWNTGCFIVWSKLKMNPKQ